MGYSAVELALRWGLTPGAVYHWENGRSPLPLVAVDALAFLSTLPLPPDAVEGFAFPEIAPPVLKTGISHRAKLKRIAHTPAPAKAPTAADDPDDMTYMERKRLNEALDAESNRAIEAQWEEGLGEDGLDD